MKPHLSPLEQQILALAVHGMTNQQIAHRLHYSYEGIRSVWRRMCPRIGAMNRTHAIALAASYQWVDLAEMCPEEG